MVKDRTRCGEKGGGEWRWGIPNRKVAGLGVGGEGNREDFGLDVIVRV